MRYYNQINNAIAQYENHKPYTQYSIDWICNRIDWCWKWKKITHEQMEELANRIIIVMDGGIYG